MNVKLSVHVNRPKNKQGFVVYQNGENVACKVSSLSSDNIKESVLAEVTKGLRACKPFISHETVLYIEIQNIHLCKWLSGSEEVKEYSEGLDSVFEVLESMDCRYRFVYVDKPQALSFIAEGTKVETKGSSIADAFADLEG